MSARYPFIRTRLWSCGPSGRYAIFYAFIGACPLPPALARGGLACGRAQITYDLLLKGLFGPHHSELGVTNIYHCLVTLETPTDRLPTIVAA